MGAVLRYGKHRRELSGGDPYTASNCMELRAALAALISLKERFLDVFGGEGRRDDGEI